MNVPRINNDDRGLTINRSLAWTILTAVVAASVLAGSTISELKSNVEQLILTENQRYQETQISRREVDSRLRSLENSRATQDSELAALRRDLTSFRSELRETVQLLREIQESFRR